MQVNNRRILGFTLIEVLIALFVFTILSTLLVGAMHRVIDAEAHTEKHVAQLRELQFGFLFLSRDIEQIVDRSVRSKNGRTQPSFFGDAKGFNFTHAGSLQWQRARYQWQDDSLQRQTWSLIDESLSVSPHTRTLLSNVALAVFEYLDKDGRFHHRWPIESDTKQPLPRAVRVSLTLLEGGEVCQTYVVPQ